MIEQQSFNEAKPTLYLVSTPIGNLLDISFRAIETLTQVDLIYAEDTRVSKKLMNHYSIVTSMKSYHEYSGNQVIEEIISFLNSGKSIALISDAGTPGISDPGYELVTRVINEKFNVVAIPGSSAILPALITSGLVITPFTFIGFLPRKQSALTKLLKSYQARHETLVIYESPLRVKGTIKTLFDTLGNRKVSLAREMTKKFESIIRSELNQLLEYDFITKGEYVIVVEGNHQDNDFSKISLFEHIYFYLSQGYSEMDAMKEVAKDRGVSKSEIYQEYKIKK